MFAVVCQKEPLAFITLADNAESINAGRGKADGMSSLREASLQLLLYVACWRDGANKFNGVRCVDETKKKMII